MAPKDGAMRHALLPLSGGTDRRREGGAVGQGRQRTPNGLGAEMTIVSRAAIASTAISIKSTKMIVKVEFRRPRSFGRLVAPVRSYSRDASKSSIRSTNRSGSTRWSRCPVPSQTSIVTFGICNAAARAASVRGLP